jgi:hypothetical protein
MDLDLIPSSTEEPKKPDVEKAKDEIEKLKADSLGLQNTRFESDTRLRDLLAKIFTMIIAFWLLGVILILVGNNCNHYNLSENVLIALLVTSTANVIGMMAIILKNLFPSFEKEKPQVIKPKAPLKKPKKAPADNS